MGTRCTVFPMKNLCLLVAFLCVPSLAFAQHGSADDAAVRKAIADHYFKAQETGAGDHLKGTFVDEGRMMCRTASSASARARTTSRVSPASPRPTKRSGSAA